jgi:PAS domain S-box-containing protein
MRATDRLAAAAALPVSDELGLFQGIVEHLGGVVLVCDVQGRVHWANSLAAEWLGAPGKPAQADHDASPLARLPGLAALSLSLPWRVDAAQLARVCAGETIRLRPETLVGADGVARRCRLRLSPLPRTSALPLVLAWIEAHADDEGDGSLSDTQRQRALAAAQVGSWSRSCVDGTARVEPLWCYSLGLDPCEGPDHLERWARRIHPDDVARFRRAGAQLAAAPADAPDFDVEYRILTADSRWLWVLQRGRVCRRDARDDRPLEAAGICIDIDARKRAEVEVHENESRLATALWGAQAAFWQLHVPSDVATRSPLWFAMTGYTEQSWNSLPSPWSSRLHPEDRAAVEQRITEHLEGRSQSLELRYRTRCADGSWKWMMDRGRVVEWDFDGKPIAAIGVSIDIDAQKRAELALHSSEARLDTAVWGAGVGLYELDCTSGAARWLNDWCERHDFEPCAGADHVERWDAGVHPEDLPAARARFRGHLEGRLESYDAEYRIRTRGGAWRWIFERGRVTEREPGGAPVRLVGTCMDIDARRRVELAAEDSRRRLELALESARGCLWEWDIALAQYNDAYYELHGVSPEQGRGQRTFRGDRAHPEDRDRVLAAEREVIEGRLESFNTQYRVRHADGSWRWMMDRFRAAARDEHGRATRLIGFAMDVTDDVQVRATLQATESALRAATESTPDWLALLDERLHIRFLNRGFRGMAVEDLLGRDAIPLLDPDWQAITGDHYRHVLATGEPRSFDIVQRVDGGEPRRLLHRVVPVKGADGGIRGISVIVTDVTAQHESERRLRESERTLRTVTANSNDWMMLLDLDNRCRFVNRPVSGHDIDRMIGADAIAMVPAAHRDEMCAAIEAVVATGQPRRVLQQFDPDGAQGRRHLEAWITAARDEDRIVGTVLTVSDITEPLRQQQALQAQALILQTMSEPVLLVDRNDVAKIVNPAFEALAGLPHAQLIGQPMTGLLRDRVADYPEITAAALAHWQANPPQVPMRREFDWRSRDGRTHRLLAAFSRVQVGGTPHVLCVYTDVTEQREVERQILEVVQRAQRRIGADLHDGLGQELTGISMLLRGLHSGVADGHHATLAQIEEVIGLVSRSVESARAMARGLAPVDPEHGGLGGALQRLAASASRQSGVHVELRYDLPPALVFSQEESTHLFRIAQEAVSNALRHAAARTVRVSLSHEAGCAVLRVSDDGRGFPEAGEPQRGLGLKTMRFRASVLRGDLQILRHGPQARRGTGITLVCRVPVHSRRLVGTTIA